MLSYIKENKKELTILLLILLLGAAIRFYNYGNFSLSNDELSALGRTQFSNLNDLINKGARVDGHPAGVQVFLYFWTKIFGDSENSIRFPFVLAGILSILISYLIAEKWFNKTTALFAASSMACLQYFILYSQIARPYSPGLLFSLLTVWFWTQIFFSSKENNNAWLNYGGFIISSSLSMCIHYFSFLFVIIVGITGFFFLKKKNYKQYILSIIAIIILYIPHLSIFLEQYSRAGVGGIDGWLGKPNSETLWLYIYYGLNNSDLVLSILIGIFIASFVFNVKEIKPNIFRTLSLLWFFIPFIIAYYYSIYRNPVLQYSVLLFSFPYFLFFIFSFLKDSTLSYKLLLLLICYTGTLSYSTIIENQYFQNNHFGVFKEIAQTSLEWEKKYEEKNLAKAININHPSYINYYFKKFGEQVIFDQYRCKSKEEIIRLKNIIDTCQTPYFMYAWSTMHNPYEIFEIIKSKYPVIEDKRLYFNSAILLYKKDSNIRKPLFIDHQEFEIKGKWYNDTISLSKNFAKSGNHSFKFDNHIEYSSTFGKKISLLIPASVKEAIINVSVFGYLPIDQYSDAELVLSFESDEKTYNWNSARFNDFIKNNKQWKEVFMSCKIPDNFSPDDKVKIYVWNPSKKEFYIDSFKISIFDNKL